VPVDSHAVLAASGVEDAVYAAGHRLQGSWEHVFDVCAITEDGLRQVR
jgi:hypothetical protein